MGIRNHLTPERDDQDYWVTVCVTKAGKLKDNTEFSISGGVGIIGDCSL